MLVPLHGTKFKPLTRLSPSSSFCHKCLRFPLQNVTSFISNFHHYSPQKANFIPSFLSFFLSKLISSLIYLIFPWNVTYGMSNIPQFFPQKFSFCHLKITSTFLLKTSPLSPLNHFMDFFFFFPEKLKIRALLWEKGAWKPL